MLDVEKRTQKDLLSSLAHWAYSAIGEPEACVRVRLRGNNLHILCENSEILEAKTLVNRLLLALKNPKQGEAFPVDQSNPISQLIIYGRTVGQDRPDWIKQISLKPLQTNEATVSPTSHQTEIDDSTATEDLLISNESLARSGSPEAIARYLGESLSNLGVSVKVVIQDLTPASNKIDLEREDSAASAFNRRLWVVCNSDYSPDSSLLAQPVVEQLRNLQLKGFRDAAICAQVSGEATPEWMLRVDLTPPEKMLKDWARWGDVQAIARTLNQNLLETGIEVRAVLKDVTLHLFCNLLPGRGTHAPDKQTTVKAIAPILDVIAPQGIQAATIYGVESHQRSTSPEKDTPIWIEWLNLPAANNPHLVESAFSLAKQGDRDAITFLLERLINSDLDRRLATGGIHLKIRRKQDLLHIMCEAPLCPSELQVAPPIASLLRQLAIPELAGVRIYGRRAGSTAPVWNYGVDFVHRRRLVPEATPEFAASDAYVDELVTPTGEPVLQQKLTKEDLKKDFNHLVASTARILQHFLCNSQLFVPTVESQELVPVTQSSRPKSVLSSLGVRVALVWGTLGLLLTLQADWLIAHVLREQVKSQGVTVSESSPQPLSLPKLSLQKSDNQVTNDFNVSGFTKESKNNVIVNEDNTVTQPKKSNAVKSAMLAAARSPNPTFNNQLLDEKLALYQKRFSESGRPDVLVIGSSRAMRGVDPQALKEALATQGYPNVTVFNIGINGATAQVVDLIIRRVLTPEQLPKLIIWADGARAFNNGRSDNTYNAIATSEGYQRIKVGTFPNQRNSRFGETGESNSQTNPIAQSLAALSGSYQSANNWLNDSVGKISSTYSQKDQLKSTLREQFVDFLKQANFPQDPAIAEAEKLTNQEAIDFDGFLPLTVRFNPTTYYKQFSKVTGDYDGDYQSFQLGGVQDAALESLMQFAKNNKINIVFVNLPLTQEYLDSSRAEYEEKFQRYLRSSALEKGFVFRDLSQLLLNKHDYFSDPSHLNRYGAYQVSNKLAQDPLISWPTNNKKK
jgi:hypothetical protein